MHINHTCTPSQPRLSVVISIEYPSHSKTLWQQTKHLETIRIKLILRNSQVDVAVFWNSTKSSGKSESCFSENKHSELAMFLTLLW